MKEMFEKGSKLLTGLLVTLMMVILFAVPVLAKSYEFQYSDSSCNNDIPYIIQSGDKLLCTEEVHDGAKVVIQINYDNPDGELIDGLDNIAHIDDSDLSNSSTIKSAGGYTEWVSESAFVSEGENDKDEKIALVMINLRAKGSGSNTEEQWVEMPEGTVGKPYSAPWIKFGDDKNIQMVSAEWCTRDNERNSGISVETGKRNAKKGLAFHLPNEVRDPLPYAIDGNEICIDGTPIKAVEYNLPTFVEISYTSDKYPDGHKIVCYFKGKLVIKEAKEEDKKDDDDDDDDDDESESSSSNNNNSSQSTWTAPAASETPAQQAAKQLTAVQTSLGTLSAMTAANKSAFSATGMPLDMTKVATIDATTAKLLVANNNIPYNVTIMFNGQPLSIKIPAGFNYSRFTKADGSINIHEVLWAVLSGAKR